METHNCIICNNPIIKQPGDTPSRYKTRKYCSKACASKHPIKTRKAYEPNYCQYCGGLIEKKKFESINRYSSRNYCSNKCAKAYFREHEIGWFGFGKMTIKGEKKKDDLPPIIWTNQEAKAKNGAVEPTSILGNEAKEPQVPFGAGNGSRTRLYSLGRNHTTDVLYPPSLKPCLPAGRFCGQARVYFSLFCYYT